MALHCKPDIQYIKIEDTPSPEPSVVQFAAAPLIPDIPLQRNDVPEAFTPAAAAVAVTAIVDAVPAIDPRDPECFLKRCAGFNKKTKLRCNSVIGKKSEQNCHPTFLPTCRAHRDQQSFAGWCQYQRANGERCGRLFRWTPPYFELCWEHQGHPDTPCYFMKLPLELRHEVFRYLLPDHPIGSTTAPLHKAENMQLQAPHATLVPSVPHVVQFPSKPEKRSWQRPKYSGAFPMPLLSLYLVSRQFHQEVKDLLFSIVPFTIDVRKDGTFMCGRRLLEPRRADGSSHFLMDEADEAKQRFLKYFDWSAVKHYVVDILVENGANGGHSTWDEEVELYDIRDYISVVVSGVLAKSRNLCKLYVRLCLANFPWTHEQTLANTKLIVGPFESLRNVRQPQIQSIYMGIPIHNSMLQVQRSRACSGSFAPICSVPPLPTQIPILVPGMPDFDTYASAWSRWISSPSTTALVPKAPIRSMFTAFKDFYSELSSYVPEVTYIAGRRAFLHRARVAREQENVEAFRELRNEAIAYWSAYLDREERKKNAMDAKMGRMLDMDVYPSHEWEESSSASNNNSNNSKRSIQLPSKQGPSKNHSGRGSASMHTTTDVASPKNSQRLKDCDELISHTRQLINIGTSQRRLQTQATTQQGMRNQTVPGETESELAQKQFLEQRARQQTALHRRRQLQQQQQQQKQRQQQKAALQRLKDQQIQHSWQLQLSNEMSAGMSNVPLPDRFEDSNSNSSSPTVSPTTSTTMSINPESSSTPAQVYTNPNPNTNTTVYTTNESTSPAYHIDETDVACYAHVNLSSEWYTDARNGGADGDGGGAGPGPSSQLNLKRRVDSGFSEMDFEMVSAEGESQKYGDGDGAGEMGYVGKGKGKMHNGVSGGGGGEGAMEVICID